MRRDVADFSRGGKDHPQLPGSRLWLLRRMLAFGNTTPVRAPQTLLMSRAPPPAHRRLLSRQHVPLQFCPHVCSPPRRLFQSVLGCDGSDTPT